jgi:adenylate cyclase
MSQQRHLAAILFTDIVGYTALMQENEQKAVALIKHYNTSLNKAVLLHEGKVLNYYGDGSLCAFPSATEALNCAIELQKELQADPYVPLRIGLHIGEVLFEDGKALGDGVNVASRIQSLGQANTILLSKEIFDKIRNHPEFKAVSLGLFDFKNVDDLVEVFALANEGLVVPKREQMAGKLKKDISKRKNTFRKYVIVGASVFILLIAGILLYLKYFNHQNYAIEKSIAVLPFVNMSTDPQQDYFADGMMDEILNHLYKMGGLKVTSRTSSLTYKGSKKTSTEIANELGVANLLEGSVQKDGDHIRIIAQLINGKTDDHLWAETYVRDFKDVFSIQSDIAQQIASALKIKIDPSVKERIESKPTENTEAYRLYLSALEVGPDNNQREHFLEAAIELDSTFANAYVILGFYWLYQGGFRGDLSSQEVLKNAEPLFQKAIQLNPDLDIAHEGLALMALYYKWDFESVEKEYKIVRRLSPSDPDIVSRIADYLLAIGKFGEAFEITSNAFEKDSSLNELRIALSLANYFNGNSKNALQLISKAYLIKTDNVFWTQFIRINVFAGEYNNAVLVFEQYKGTYGPIFTSTVLGYIGIAYYKTGRKDSAENILKMLKTRSVHSPVGSPSFYIAAIYTSMGENDEAIQWLQKAYKDHEVEMYWLKVDPQFTPLHKDPRFQEILVNIGFK